MAINVKDFSRQISPGFKAIVDILDFNGWRSIYEEQDIVFRKKRGFGEIWLTPFFSDEIIAELGEGYIRDTFGDDAWEGMKHPSVIYMPEDLDEDEPITLIDNLNRASVADIHEALGKLEDQKKIEVYESAKANRKPVVESNIRSMAKKAFDESATKADAKRPVRESAENYSFEMPWVGGGLNLQLSDMRKGIIVSTYSSSHTGHNIYQANPLAYSYEDGINDLVDMERDIQKACDDFQDVIADILIKHGYIA